MRASRCHSYTPLSERDLQPIVLVLELLDQGAAGKDRTAGKAGTADDGTRTDALQSGVVGKLRRKQQGATLTRHRRVRDPTTYEERNQIKKKIIIIIIVI